LHVFVEADIELPEQLLAVKPSVSKKDAECPAGLRGSSHEKLKAILDPPGPASVADTGDSQEGITTPETAHAVANTTPRFQIFNLIVFIISRPAICLTLQILLPHHP
jgi:hypothetical protein